jgi:exodeoxyribonuclease VII large subunit
MPSHESLALSVSAVAKFIYSIISQNIAPLWIRGEVSNLKIQQNGNAYFSIKDTESKINAMVMAYSGAKSALPDLKNGLEVLIYGKISYYKKEGSLTIFVEEIEFLGEGLLKLKFDELKKKLEQEGLFAREHKKKIPEFPSYVGVVTSPTGAAIQDILNVTMRRFGNVNMLVFPAAVQGECAAQEIASAIEVANRYAGHFLDVLIVGRGGGSIEDLWCFNEEVVARAIYASKIPVISAVGHEIDYTIADYVADLRAPTPSAAAELVVKDRTEILRRIQNLTQRMENFILNRIDFIKKRLEIAGKERLKQWMQSFVMEYSQALDNLKIRLNNSFKTSIQQTKNKLLIQKEKLEALHPQNILKRGYSITSRIENDGTKRTLHSYQELQKGEKIQTLLYHGNIESTVEKLNQ